MATSADEVANKCTLLGGTFAMLVQLGLAVSAIATLVYKRAVERPRRPCLVWFFDASKQAFAGVLQHGVNLMFGVIFFRGQSLDPPAQVRLARRFGELDRHPIVKGMPEYPDVLEIVREAGAATAAQQQLATLAEGAELSECGAEESMRPMAKRLHAGKASGRVNTVPLQMLLQSRRNLQKRYNTLEINSFESVDAKDKASVSK